MGTEDDCEDLREGDNGGDDQRRVLSETRTAPAARTRSAIATESTRSAIATGAHGAQVICVSLTASSILLV